MAVGDSQFTVTQVIPSFVASRISSKRQAIGVGNAAVGGTRAVQWADSASALYQTGLATLRTAMMQAPGATVKGLLVCLGTNDADTNQDHSLWTTSMITLLANLRADLGMNLPCVFLIMPPTTGSGKSAAFWSSIRAQMAAFHGTNNATGVQVPDGDYLLHYGPTESASVAALISAAVP